MSTPGTPPSASERLAAIEALDDIVVGVDRDLRITSWNDAAERLLDRPAGVALGGALLTMITPGMRIAVTHLLDRALKGETIKRQPVTFIRRDGSEVVMSTAIAPIVSAEGRPSGLVVLGHDLGEQQRLQYQLLQAKRRESTGQLAGGVAHEFNNILTTILGLADFVARASAPESVIRKDVDEIRHQAETAARLVRHLLAFSRRQLLRTESTLLGPVLQELEPLLRQLIGERVLITTDVAPEARAVEIDRAQIELVLLELISNAADAMEENGGSIDIVIEPTELDGHATLSRGHYVQLTLRDTGKGIAPADREHVFEPFFTTRGEGHPGLGLSMVEGVISQHGGAISLESVPGEGTAITLLLPAARRITPVAQSALPPDAAIDDATETVLVAEDETAVRSVLVRALRSRGYEVLEAKNGEDALLVAERHNAPIHLVITDVVMPSMNGTELFHALRGWYPRMRVLFISGYARSTIPPDAFVEGQGAAFLAKPFTVSQLLTEVRRLLQAPRRSGAPV